jgi:hypothetical protein
MSVMHAAAAFSHPLVRATSGLTAPTAAGVSVSEITNTVGGILVALISAVGLFIGISRNNKKNRELAKKQRKSFGRNQYRRGYSTRDRELAQIVSNAAYWQTYALENRRPDAPIANPPIVVPSPLPPDLVPVEDDPDGDEEEL